MTSKAQERNLLEKIRSIIMGTEPGSYLRLTFHGILEMAEKNIENDTAFNALDDYREECARNLKKDAENGKIIRKLETERDILRKENAELKATLKDRDHIIDAKDAELARTRTELRDLRRDDAGVDEYVDELRAKIQELKAEIYDLERKVQK